MLHESRLQIKISGDTAHNPMKDTEKAKLLFELEQWLNNDVATQAFLKFKVGLRVYISISNKNTKNSRRL